MYLSGIRPSLELTLPLHQSFDTCAYNVTCSPFLKLSSRSDLATKSNCTVASKLSHSIVLN